MTIDSPGNLGKMVEVGLAFSTLIIPMAVAYLSPV
jgi:cellulose biosynthesis protein BcsQ